MERVLEAGHTHLHPGLRGFLRGPDPGNNGAAGDTCRIDFADGSVAFGTLKPGGGGSWEFEAGPYITAAGTRIPARRWSAELGCEPDGRTAVRILGRLAAG
jgi:hypothetical protein